jgi:hypothetical protein
MKISEHSEASPRSDETQLPQAAVVANRFGKFDIAQRARFLGRLLASVGPLALKVVGGGVFAKYVRYARSSQIPVSFEDAAGATSSQVRDLVHYVEQSNPRFVEGLSTTLPRNDVPIAAAGPSISHREQTPPEMQGPARRVVGQQSLTRDAPSTSPSTPRIEPEDPPRGLRLRRRDLRDY